MNNNNITLTRSESSRIRAQLRTLRDLDGKPLQRRRLANIANRLSLILSNAERRTNRKITRS